MNNKHRFRYLIFKNNKLYYIIEWNTVLNIILIPTFYYYFSKKINLSIIAAFIMIIIAIPTIIFT